MKTMKAVRIHSYGGPEVLTYEDAPIPNLQKDDVLIEVHAAGVNPVDWKIRGGYRKDFLKHKLPLILGWDVSGTIKTVGTEVKNFKPGDEVYGRIDLMRDGSYAEYVAAKAAIVASKPKSLNHIEAAAVPLATLTAWQALFDTAHLTQGQTVLIHAAAGGVGHMAVQLAKWKGAKVIGTASGEQTKFLLDLGIDKMIDYKKDRFEEKISGVDIVFDTMGGETQKRSWQVLKPGGILVSLLGEPSQESAQKHNVKGLGMLVQPNAKELSEITQLIDSKKIKVIVQTVLPLSEARRSHELSESGHTHGKIVLKVKD